ncbi:MAG: hypothetical protein WCA35_21425 [Kovacikia sp.]
MEPLAGGNAPTPPLILCPNQTGDSYTYSDRKGIGKALSRQEGISPTSLGDTSLI